MPGKGAVQVVAAAHPLRSETVRADFPAGLSLAQMLGQARDDLYVELDGEPVPRERWAETIPGAGQTVTVRVVPGDGQTFLSFALLAASLWIPGALGLSGVVKGVAAAGIMALGQTLIGPPTQNTGGDEIPQRRDAITGVRNQINPYGPIPRVYGRHRFYPPLAAMPYTEIVGDAQYMRMLFCLGYGPLDISDPRIGDTPITSYEGVQYEVTESPTLFVDSVFEEALSVTLARSDQAGNSATRTTQADAEEISVDLTFPQGLARTTKKGKRHPMEVGIKIEYSPAGANTWSNVIDAQGLTLSSGLIQVADATQLRVNAETNTPQRAGIRWRVAKGQYDVRVTRTYEMNINNVYGAKDVLTDATTWTALRTINHNPPVNTSGILYFALVVKASDQLNRVIDRFNCIAQARLQVWDGSTWSEQATRNPAWAYADVLSGSANARALPTSRLVASELKAWADECTAKGYNFDAVIDYRTTVFELCRDIAAAGRASWALPDGQYSVVRDTGQTVPVQHFTPRNSWGFRAVKRFPDLPHAIKIRFLNEDADWQEDLAIVYDDGYTQANATKFESLEFRGVTNYNHAWKLGRYYLAALRLRPEEYELNVDVEHLVARRGDYVVAVHDVPLWGLGAGRIKSVTLDGSSNVTAITVDEELVMDGAKSYAVRIRTASNQSVLAQVVTVAGTNITSLTLQAPVSGPQAGDLFLFGEFGNESVDLIVTRIEPGPDLTARVVLADKADAIQSADSGAIPPFSPGITLPADPATIKPPAPIISSVASDESVLVRAGDGALQSRIVVGFQFVGASGFHALRVEGRYRISGSGGAWATVPPVDSATGAIPFGEVEDGVTYALEIRTVTAFGVPSDWTATTETVIGKTTPPADVTGFFVAQNGSVAVLRWDPNEDPDLEGYILRYRPRGNTTWEDATPLTTVTRGTNITTADLPPGDWTLLIKAVDSATVPNESLTAATADLLFVNTYDVISSAPQAPDWGGTLTNFVRHYSGVLVPSSQLPADGEFTNDTFTAADGTLSGSHTSEGSLWTDQQTGLPDNWSAKIYGNRLVGVSNELNIYDANAKPPVADYVVSADLYVASIQGNMGIAVRHDANNENYYGVVTDGATWTLFKNGGYLQSDILATLTQALIVGWTYRINLEVVGDTLNFWIGATKPPQPDMTATDSGLDGAGNPAIIKASFSPYITSSTSDTATTGFHIDNFRCATLLDGWEVFDQFVPYPFPTCTYEATEVDLGFDSAARVWADIESALGFGETGIADPRLQIDYRPVAGAYDGFEAWSIGNLTARYFKFQLSLDTTKGVAYVSAFTPTIDNEERKERKTGLTVPATGLAVTFDKPFHQAPWIDPMVEGVGLTATHTNVTTTGFTLWVFDSTGSPVAVSNVAGYEAIGV